MTPYKHFTQINRKMLGALKRKDFTQEEIARELGINQSSISRELKRNKDKNDKYHAAKATQKYINRRKAASQKLKRIENDYWLK